MLSFPLNFFHLCFVILTFSGPGAGAKTSLDIFVFGVQFPAGPQEGGVD